MSFPLWLRAVVQNGQLLEQDTPTRPLPWWSLSKTTLATAALVLVQQDKLELDRLLAPAPYTLRQLLNHTAGLPDYGRLAAYHAAVAAHQTPWPAEELLERTEAQRLRSAPGERFAYSNVGYLLVRQLIEQTTGLASQQALEQLVFRPLGVEGLKVAETTEALRDCHDAVTPNYHPGWVFHGLILGTPAQAALFLDRVLGGDLLTPALLQSMRSGVPIAFMDNPERPWRSADYGLGLMIDPLYAAGPCYGHTGAGPGSSTATYRCETPHEARTASVFAGGADQGVVEREALRLATAPNGPRLS